MATTTFGEPVVLTGWPGVGKTTITAAIANDLDVAAAFPGGVFWTALDQAPNLLLKIAEWGRALGDEGIQRAPTIADASLALGRLLDRRRALLIIDDAWDAEHVQPFLAAAGSCQVLISTRLPEVAGHLALNDEAMVRLPPLAPDDAVALLRVVAGRVVDDHLQACRDLAISLECLPLSLTVAGRMIAAEARCGMDVAALVGELGGDSRAILAGRPPADWSQAAGRAPESVKVVVEKSVSRLPPDLQDCFAVLGEMVPKPSTFDLGVMKGMWQVDDPRPAARQLVDAGLIEPMGGGRFQMHAVLVDYANAMLDD